jgi:hypothetical protein
MLSARNPQQNAAWKWLLLGMCALLAVWIFLAWCAWFGFGGRPWEGFWDVSTGDAAPFIIEFGRPEAGGATARAGIRQGDRADLREQSWAGRIVLFTQPLTVQPTTLVLHRGFRTFVAHIVGSTIYERGTILKVLNILPQLLVSAWLLACAVLIAMRQSSLREGRTLALILLCFAPNFAVFVLPNPTLTELVSASGSALNSIAGYLLVRLASQFGSRPLWRRLLEGIAYGVVALQFLWVAYQQAWAVTLGFHLGSWGSQLGELETFAVALAAVAAVVTTPQQRPRAGWLLLPIPLSYVAFLGINVLSDYIGDTWVAEMALAVAFSAVSVIAAMLVTYALLRRRVLDVTFVLNRAIVVSIVSLIVVCAFVLLEWVLGSVVAGVSHSTGLIANAALALVIGVSLNYIHQRVDHSVDRVLFRKRHEDEHALLAFSKEAAYVTDWDALLDATLEKVRRHTDAQSAALLVGAKGFFTTVRSFGDDMVVSIGENDEAILALKAWHKPIHPHHYDTALRAVLALPMLARGRLYGVLMLGERAGGEAYAPDEVEALSQLANGVGSALEALSLATDGSAAALAERMERAIASMAETLAEMRAEMRSEIRSLRTPSPT